ncbi:MAG: trypsin-like peptidase domain-containing protein [Chitinophagaceae bacterium]|nr:trypsin-like peptidase domain-containing protein [Chitinophagaceae bacterium]MBL0305408.1 trypsin-like peptidase domain-containing protein [Chitinophagaceae bacterium]HQV59172.1 trypsin-like peptidase domain-containing protein [Chitinophagaceae bacterium]HQX73590.1 trypsin-like peptidase domain-containing protein [Chitinophagaceae bacterium]HQZ73786.1 trypsin-like peptidase domain-containing protein [Chitinophagaceae bacterium]
MGDIKVLEAVERYIRGEMNPDERLHFENLRKTNPEIDQLVVEHTLFLQQMNRFGEWKKFRSSLNDVHTDLAEQGKIDSARLNGKAKVVYLWKRYKRVAAIAASIAGITTLTFSALVWSITPQTPASEIDLLKGKINVIENKTKEQDKEINKVKNKINTADNTIVYTTGGTGFIIDAKGYLVTNAHVVEGAKNIAVQNSRGEYMAKVVHINMEKDIAILKIDDESFKPYASVPYTISRSAGKLAEPIFTLGYPRSEIVYGQGYLSAKTGFNGDTLSCQLEIAANRGNSGSPILNKKGEVIGILNGRQRNIEGFAFAIQGKYIYNVLDELKKDSIHQKVKISSKSSIAGLDFQQQVEKVEDYVFMVKVN